MVRKISKVGLQSNAPQRLRMIEKLSLEDLRRKVLRYREAYYNGEAIISDEEFDALESRLKEIAPKDPLLTRIGHKPVSGKKVLLPYPMGSLSKIRAATGATRWLDKHSLLYVSDKLDGVSVLIQNDGKPHYRMFTRGDGKTGQDISYLVPSIAGIGKLRRGQAVRGELLIPKSNFALNWAETFVNARNLVSGAVNSKRADPKLAKDILFIAHEVVSPATPPDQAYRFLKSNGFHVVDYTVMQSPTIEELEDYLARRKQESKFEIDGLVLAEPSGDIIAYKSEVEAKEALVKKIEWSLSRHQIYKPVVLLTKPIMLSGANVTRVTGHNARYVIDNGIGPGAKIKVTRSGDVIPKVVGVVKKTKPNMPKEYTWDANRVDILGEPTTGEEGYALTAKRLSEALRVLGVPNTRERQLYKLAEHGIDTLYKLFRSDDTDFQEAGLGPTQADSLFTGLKQARLTVSHLEMMKASGIFPRGYGLARFEAILNEIPYDKLKVLNKTTLLRNIAEIPGFTQTTAKNFIKYLPDYVAFVNKLRWKPKKVNLKTDDPIYGLVIVFTGFRNRIWEGVIKARGGKVAAGVTKATTLVVYTDKTSAKVVKAKNMAIRVMSKEAFIRAFNMPT